MNKFKFQRNLRYWRPMSPIFQTPPENKVFWLIQLLRVEDEGDLK